MNRWCSHPTLERHLARADGKMCFRAPKAGVAEKELKPAKEGKEQPQPSPPSLPVKEEGGRFKTIPMNALSPSPFDMRPKEDQEIGELAENIKSVGVLEPIIVRSKPDGMYEVVCGGRRLRAAEAAGLAEVPCIVRDLSDEDVLLAQISENVARKDVSDITKARQLKQLIDTGYTQTQIADKLGKSKTWVSRHLGMLELETLLPRGNKVLEKITEGQARVILSAPSDAQKSIVKWMGEEFEKSGELPSARETQEKIGSLMIERELKVEEPIPKPEKVSVPVRCSNCKNLTYSPHFLKDRRMLCDGCLESLVSAGLVAEEEVVEHPKVEVEPKMSERPKSYCPICGHIIGARLADAVDNLRERFPEFFEGLEEALEE